MARDASESEVESLPVDSTLTMPIAQTNGLDMPINSQHVYEVRPREDKRGVDLISDALPFGRLWPAAQDRARIVFDLPNGK